MSFIRPPGPVARRLRIGILGGSFNPAHAGHLYISEVALRRLHLDYVWWLVSPQNPLKSAGEMGLLPQRLAAARRVARHPRIVVSDIEADIGTIYTIDTLKFLKARFPQVRFVWLMGTDNLMQFHRWRAWRKIAEMVPIAVVLRPGSTLAPLKAPAMRRLSRFRSQDYRHAPALIVLDGRRNEQSASAIRALGDGNEPVLN
jgi:nicotinate-nucleotide adenylyltransferase